MWRKNSLFILIMLLVFSLSVALFGCGKDQASSEQKADLVKSEKKQQADTIRLGGGDWGYPTPFAHYSRGPGSRKMRLIFDTLVASDAEGKILPRLAAVWQVSEEGPVYTFKLRPGVK